MGPEDMLQSGLRRILRKVGNMLICDGVSPSCVSSTVYRDRGGGGGRAGLRRSRRLTLPRMPSGFAFDVFQGSQLTFLSLMWCVEKRARREPSRTAACPPLSKNRITRTTVAGGQTKDRQLPGYPWKYGTGIPSCAQKSEPDTRPEQTR